METIYPRSDHYPPYLEISNKDLYFAVGNPIFSQISGHQRDENEARNTKMYQGQETHPIRINARYEMNWANNFFKNFQKPHFWPNICPPEALNEVRDTKMYRSQKTHPLRVNARYEMNWANSFLKKFRKPHFRPNIWPPEGQKWG